MLQPASIQSAAAPLASILLAEAVGNLAMYSLGFAAGGFSKIHSTSLDANKSHDFSWLEVSKKNKNRVKQRSSDKAFTLMLVFLSFMVQGISNPIADMTALLPSFKLMVLYKVYMGSLGITDELDDLPEDIKTRQSKLACSISTAAIIAAIPVMMCGLPSLYIPYAIAVLGTHGLAGKIDNPFFQAVGFLGILSLFAVTFAMKLPLKSFPLVGIFMMMAAEALWQIHDEHPGLIKLTKNFPSLNKVWRILNKNTFMLFLTVFGLLPLPWLTTSSPAYAVAKVGLAKGVLSSKGLSSDRIHYVPKADNELIALTD
mmetsp:Transcript_23296/g.29751  ORF Transcript_23296/g.29751 Transcript_23296/m.29751 type:complete len:314 (+) Transcript_23296:98-1039(+)